MPLRNERDGIFGRIGSYLILRRSLVWSFRRVSRHGLGGGRFLCVGFGEGMEAVKKQLRCRIQDTILAADYRSPHPVAHLS